MVPILFVITTLLWGTTPIIEKIGLGKIDPLIGITIRSFIVTGGLLILIFLLGKQKELIEIDLKGFLTFSASGLMAGLFGMWTYFIILKAWPTSKVVPIAASYPLITVILSIFLLKESVNISRLLGTLFIVIGIWLVKR